MCTARVARVVLAVLAVALATASPASAGLSTWSGLPGLNAGNGAGWIRDYATGTPPTTIYAATEGDGVYRSTNDGLNWAPFSSGLDAVPGAKIVRTVFTAGGKVFAGTSAGLFASSGGGAWTPIAQGPEDDPAHPKKLNLSVQAVLTGATGQILAGTFAGGVYKSTDDGQTWTPPAPGNGMPSGETVWSLASLAPNVIFAATSSGMYRSIDFGSSWTLASDGISGTTLRVFADGTNPNIYYAATPGNGVFRSINGGITWSASNGTGSHALGNSTVRALKQFSGASLTRLYAGTANGVYAGTTGNGALPGAVSWRKVTNSGLGANTIFWALSSFTQTPGTLLAGTQSNGGYALTFEPPSNTSVPSIGGGTLNVGKTLLANSGSWSGTQTIEFDSEWQRCATAQASSCNAIPGATEPAYDLQPADLNNRVRVVVTASNDFPTVSQAKAASAISGIVGAQAGTLPGETQSWTASIATLGPGSAALPQSGDTLHAQGWLFNPTALSVGFQWFGCDANGNNCVAIPGATPQNYSVSDADVGDRLCVKVTGTNVSGSATLGCSGVTNTIFPEQATNLTPPTLAGQAFAGESLVAGVGTWKYPGTTYLRQWEKCGPDGSSCSTISGQTAPSYTVRGDDVGDRIRARITADSNGANVFPSPVEVYTPLSDPIARRPVPPPPPGPGGGGPGGGGGGGGGGADVTAPVLQSARLAPRKVKRGGNLNLGYVLSEPSTLSISIERLYAGRRKGSKCVRGGKKGRRCTVAKGVGTIVSPTLSGPGTLPLKAQIGKKKLAAGNYRAIVTPSDAAGNRGAAVAVAFKVTR